MFNTPQPLIPATAPAAPLPTSPTVGQRPGKKSMQPSFLGTEATPQSAAGGKTLLGQ